MKLFVATLLDHVPPAQLGHIVEHIAGLEEHQLESTLAHRTWYHPGLRDFVTALALRLVAQDDEKR